MNFLSLTILSSLFFVASAYGETPLTQEDKEGLVGDYRFEGHYKQSRNIVVELTISLDENGDLIGTQRDKNDKSRGQWWHKTYTNYRRLAPNEWTIEWQVKSLPGDRCGKDRHCFVANMESTINWNGTDYYYSSFRLQQYSLDFQEVQNYTVEKKGMGGGMSSPYQKISGGKVATVTNGTETPAATETDSSNTVSSLKEKLLELKSLVEDGLITQEDYENAKKQILDKL